MTGSVVKKRLRGIALAALGTLTLLGAGGVLHPQPAHAWWRGGVWYGGPGFYGPRPYYAPPPIYYPPPPVYYAPPVYVPPPPVYYPPAASYPGPARTCFTPAMSCPMEVARAPGAACYCSNAAGGQSWGQAH